MAERVNKKRIRWLADLVGLPLDPWQVDAVLEADKHQVFALSAPRQNGKTQIVLMVMLLWALRGWHVLFLTHRMDNVRREMSKMVGLCSVLKAQGLVTKISNSNGFYEIYFASGGSILFRVRTPGVGVGLTVDAIIWDEAQKVDGEYALEAVATMRQSKWKKELLVGTPPTKRDFDMYPDAPFIQMKKNGGDNYREYSAAAFYDASIPLTIQLARKANPAYRRTNNFWKDLQSNYAKTSHRQFMGQYMGVWWFPQVANFHDPELKPDEVAKMLTLRGSTATRFVASVGILPGSDRAYVAMSDGVTVEIAEEFDLGMGQLDGVIDWLKEHMRTISQVRIPANQRGQTLAKLLDEKNIGKKVRLLKMPETGNNIARFLAQAKAGSLLVYGGNNARIALSSFWLTVDQRSGSVSVGAGIDSDAALVLALVNATVDEKLSDRLKTTGAHGRSHFAL
mgnify:FL=1|jgi:hypothetical protein